MSPRENKKKVLMEIVKSPSTTNKRIAEKLNLSSAGVGKIRKKMESDGTIDKYFVRLDADKMGLESLSFVHLKIKSKGWELKGNNRIEEKLIKYPNVVGAYRIMGREITHILFCIYKSQKELEDFLHSLQADLSEFLSIKQTYIFTPNRILKDSYNDLYNQLIDET